jgi:hypothetical protein
MRMVDAIEEVNVVQEEVVPVVENQTAVLDKYIVVEKKDLITRGKLYPQGTKILARTLTVPEVKRLSTITLNPENADFVITDTLKKAIKGIDINDLYIADKMYLLFLLRANTFKDSSYTVTYYCSKCEKESRYHFTMSNITANFLPDNYDPKREFVLKNGAVITFKHLRVRDQAEISNLMESPMVVKNTAAIDVELLSVAASINTIDGKKKSLFERYEFVSDELAPEDYSDIMVYLEEIDIGVDSLMNVTCEECGGAGQIPVNFRTEFFFPKRRIV